MSKNKSKSIKNENSNNTNNANKEKESSKIATGNKTMNNAGNTAKPQAKKTIKPKETLSQQVVSYIMAAMTITYTALMLCIFPIYNENKYFNMGDAKYHFFKYVTLFFIILLILMTVIARYVYRERFDISEFVNGFSRLDWCVIAYLIATAVSFLCSSYKSTAIWGFSGWYMGVISQELFILIYFYLSRCYRRNTILLPVAMVTSAIVFQIGILQRFSIDPFGFYDGLSAEYIEKFISTLGQTTWYSSYAVLITPICFYYYWASEKVWARVLAGLSSALCFGMLCTTNSDSAYIAFAFIIVVFLWFSLENEKSFMRFLELCMIGLATFRIIGIEQKLHPEKMIQLITGTEATSKFITSHIVMLILLIMVAAIYAALVIYHKYNGEITPYLKWLRPFMLAAIPLFFLAIIVLIVLTTTGKLPAGLSKLYDIDFLHFTEDWGNQRGFNWRMAWKAFTCGTWKEKLIGVGPDCFVKSMDSYCVQEVADYWQGKKLACAHNEFLNMLVTNGILGLLAYLSIFVMGILRLGKGAYKDKAIVPFVAVIFAYMGHNFFCYQQCICTPILFLLVGMGECYLRHWEKEHGAKVNII